MLLTLLFVVFVYLFAVESFTAFLYPDPAEVASYFRAAELPGRLFDMMIGAATLTTIVGWCYLYMKAHGRSLPVPAWINTMRIWLYVLFLNRLYVDECLHRLSLFWSPPSSASISVRRNDIMTDGLTKVQSPFNGSCHEDMTETGNALVSGEHELCCERDEWA